MTSKKRGTTQIEIVTELTKSKSDFSGEIDDRIVLGKTLYKKEINNPNDYNSFQRQYSKWDDYNVELLKQSFNKANNEYVDSYQNAGDWTGMFVTSVYKVRSPYQDYTDLKEKIQNKIENLEKLHQKINLLKTSINTHSNDTIQCNVDKDSVFIVHGHDELAKTEVARFLEQLHLKAIILHEQANAGDTIIEKIEKHTNVGFGIVLYTQCDVGSKVGKETDLKFRARQNVVFEHGFLIGKIGRKNVCALVKGEIETPSDISGVIFIPMDTSWKWQIAKELRESGYSINMNLI